MKKLLFLCALLFSAPAFAQWQTPAHSVPVGVGAGVTGFNAAIPSTAGIPLVSTGASTDPAFGAISNAGMATMPALTFKCNPTAGTAAPQDCNAAGVATGPGRVVTSTPTLSTLDCSRPIQLGGNALYSVTVAAAGSFPTGCHLKFTNTDVYSGPGTGRGKIMIIPGVAQHPLYPGQVLDVRNDNGSSWVPDQQINGSLGQLWIPTSSPTMFSDNGGSNTANDGLASGAANAFAGLDHCYMVMSMQVIYKSGNTVYCKHTAGQSITLSLNILFYNQAQIPFQIQSTVNGSPFIWNCPAAQVCILFGDYGGMQLQDITFNMANAPIIFGHQYGVVDFETGITLNGNNGSFPYVTCDYLTQFNIQAGLTFSGSANLLLNGCSGSRWNINGALTASSATLGRYVNATSGANVNFQGNVTFGGSISTSVSLVSGNSVVNNQSGAALPGGAPTPTTGGQYCTAAC